MNRAYPCKNCEERYVGCHSFCERYKKIEEENRKEIEQRRTEEIGHAMWLDHMLKEYRKRRRKHGKK